MNAVEVVILTTSSTAGDNNFIKMKTFSFQCMVKGAQVGRHASLMDTYATSSGI